MKEFEGHLTQKKLKGSVFLMILYLSCDQEKKALVVQKRFDHCDEPFLRRCDLK